MRADLWRYCVLYAYGGVYFDMETRIRQDVDKMIREDDRAVLIESWPPSEPWRGACAALTWQP